MKIFQPVALVLFILASTSIALGQCAYNTSFTATPPPTNGTYSTGETVEFCGSFMYTQSGAAWAHGIIPNIPPGWDITSMQITPPTSCGGSGTWGWYESVTGTAWSAGTYGPGIFYNQGGDNNPGNNFGDNCFSGSFNFCITLTAVSAADCAAANLNGSDMTVSFTILGDNLSGSWSSTTCGEDLIPGTPATLTCCSGEDVTLEVCETGAATDLFDEFTATTPAGGTWQAPGGGAFDGTFIPGTSADGVYTYSFSEPDCTSESTVEVTTVPAPVAGTGENITLCEGAPAFDLFDQIVDGDAGGTWLDPSNNPTTGTFTPGTSTPGLYTYSVGDGVGCPVSETVVIVTIEPNPDAGEDGSLTVCESDPGMNLFNFLLGTPETGGEWTTPAGGTHDGQLSPNSDAEGDYTYTVGTAPCASTAIVSVTIIDLPYAGEDASLTICPDDAEIDLFTLLPGADAGGFWADPNNAGFDGLFTPGTDPDGDYVYQMGGAACNDIATVTVTSSTAPQATVSAAATYCENTPFDISFELAGTGPFDVTYSINNADFMLTGIADGHIESVTATGDAEITIVSVSDNSAGGCSATGNTIEVEMIPTPSATLSGGGAICEGTDADLTFTLTGSGPFDVVYSDGNQNFSLNAISTGHIETVTLTENTTFTLVSVSDNSTSSCEGVIVGTAEFVVNPAPSGTITGSADICAGESVDLTFELEGTAPFDVVYTDGADNFTLLGIEDGHTVSVSPQFLSFYQLVSVVSQGNTGCPGATNGNVEITVSVPPVYNNLLVTCNDVNEGYVVSFTIEGGNPATYAVTGDSGTLAGNQFTSDEIASGEDYAFSLDDGNECGPVLIVGSHTCDCTTEAGTMQATALEFCSSETAVANHNANENLDANDALIFVLHDGSATTLGVVLDENSTPNFDFGGTMETGVTYFISPVAANADGISIDYDDPCLSVGAGVAVVFIESPEATLSGTGAICPGETAALDIALTGTAPWSIDYAIDGVFEETIQTNDDALTIEAAQGGTYTLISVSDDVCTGTVSGEVEVEAHEVPTATISAADVCAGSGEGPAIVLTGVAPWAVSYNIDGGVDQTINITDSPYILEATVSGMYTITSVADANCEGDGDGPVEVNIIENPTATISGGGQICADDLGTITFTGGGSGEVDISYAIDGVESGTVTLVNGIFDLETSEPGTYTITEISDEFCTGTPTNTSVDLVVNPLPTATISLTPQTICEGDSALLSIEMTGNGPYNLVYSSGDDLIIADNISNVNSYITPTNGQEFQLISIEDSSNPSCAQNLSQSIAATVLPVPETPVLENLFRCNNDEFPQIGVESSPGLSYQWSPENGLTNPNISNPVLNLENNTGEEQTYTYTLTVSNGTCEAQSNMEVAINPGPTVDFSYNPNPVVSYETTVNFTNLSDGFYDYQWEIDSVAITTSTHFIYEFPNGVEANYLISLTAEDPETGCVNSYSEILEVVGELTVFVPNAFTPDGDGINDLFAPVIRNQRDGTYSFSIYNRQGELVFQSNSPDQKWDGSDASQEHYSQDGVYVWILQVDDDFSTQTKEYTGSVTVLR